MTRVQICFKEIENETKKYGIELTKKDHCELVNNSVLLLNKEPTFFFYKESESAEKRIIPTLYFLAKHPVMKKITVDMGAIKFIVGGADVMRPGIVGIENEISKGDIVVIIDVQHKKQLAVGIALFSSQEMQQMSIGKVVKNIHYVGDWMWKLNS